MDIKISPLAALNDAALLKTDALIDGRWVPGSARFPVADPATGLELAQVANLGAGEAEVALAAANKAWPAWRSKTAKERAAVLMKWFHLLHQHADDLARIMTAEQGKPLAEAKGEVAYGASFIEWFAEEAKRVYGETVPTTDNDKRYLVLKQSMGVAAAITPWNFPIGMITRKVAPALAAGCPVVIKPAEQTPLSALAVAELAQRAGMPAGVLNVLTADAQGSIEIGNVLCASDIVRHLSFTGSTEVGRILMQQCAPTIKKLSLELGGNAPFIVFDDADLDSAVEGALASKYRNAGQTCVCANRLYVQDGVYDAFVEKLAAKAKAIKVGNGFEAGVSQGPLIDDAAIEKVERHVADATAKGAKLVVGGKRLHDRFFEPTVLAGATSDMLCAREETFGPVAPVFRFKSEDEAIAAANATEFGLASYFYSRDVGRIFRVAEALESGMVGINTGLISTAEVPFGGVKQSGLGREGSHHGIDDYVEIKYLCLGGIGAMNWALEPRHWVLIVFVASALFIHFRGKVRFPLKRALDFTIVLAPVNALMYLFSRVPARAYLDAKQFPELEPLHANWQTIRDEALRLNDEGHIRASDSYNDIGFNSFFRTGWKRFYLTWYGKDLASAQAQCPQTVALLKSIPSVKAAMFASLPPGATLQRHRDPYAGSLRYHLGLATPNDPGCFIEVDGQRYHWKDGEVVMFDETFIHHAANQTQQQRVVLFCDIERPLHTAPVRWFNRFFATHVMAAASSQNESNDEPVGAINKVFFYAYQLRLKAKALKASHRQVYYAGKWLLIGGAIWWLFV